MKPEYIWITVRNPRGNDVGEIAEAWFVVDDENRVQLTNRDGVAMPGQDTRRRIMDGETPCGASRPAGASAGRYQCRAGGGLHEEERARDCARTGVV